MSIADGELRNEVQEILAKSERDHTARVAAAWEQLAALFGYRLQPGATFAVLATLLTATMRGLIITALSLPEMAGPQAHGNPFGADGDWSLDAIGLTSIALAFLEPDPATEWDPQRVAAVRQAPQLAVPAGRLAEPYFISHFCTTPWPRPSMGRVLGSM